MPHRKLHPHGHEAKAGCNHQDCPQVLLCGHSVGLGRAKFEIETFQNVNDDCNSSWVLYPNEESYLEEKRRQEKLQAIREYFRNWAREVPSEIVNGVYELIRAEVEMDAD